MAIPWREDPYHRLTQQITGDSDGVDEEGLGKTVTVRMELEWSDYNITQRAN